MYRWNANGQFFFVSKERKCCWCFFCSTVDVEFIPLNIHPMNSKSVDFFFGFSFFTSIENAIWISGQTIQIWTWRSAFVWTAHKMWMCAVENQVGLNCFGFWQNIRKMSCKCSFSLYLHLIIFLGICESILPFFSFASSS